MKGFALILAFLVLEAAFLWHVAAPRSLAPARAPAPVASGGTPESQRAPGMARGGAPSPEGVRYRIRTLAREGRPADLLQGFSL